MSSWEALKPGVTRERLGVGPEEVMERNAAIVYGRLTQVGFGAKPLRHSLNYEAITGVIRSVGPVAGACSAPPAARRLRGWRFDDGVRRRLRTLESRQSGRGQIVDAAMTDGVLRRVSVFYGMQASGMHTTEMAPTSSMAGPPSMPSTNVPMAATCPSLRSSRISMP